MALRASDVVGGGMRDPIEGHFRVLGDETRKEPIFHMPNLLRFVGGIAAAMAIGWGLRWLVKALFGYG